MSKSILMDNNPKPITEVEWKEIVGVRAVRELWGLDEDADPHEFAKVVYGAKFNFVSGGPGYFGDLYVLQGDAISDAPPVVLKRDDRSGLVLCYHSGLTNTESD